MNLQVEPDVAFGVHPTLGVAAAVADDRPFLDDVLRKHQFRYSTHLDVYVLPDDTPHSTTIRTVASATREFQASGLSVAADPRIAIPPPVPTVEPEPAREVAAGQSLTAQSGELPEVRRPTEEFPHSTHLARTRAAAASSPLRPPDTPPSLEAAARPHATPPGSRRRR